MYYDPAKIIEFTERRTKGCFACLHSDYDFTKRSAHKVSHCKLIEAGLLEADYPNMDVDSCSDFKYRVKRT